MVDEVLYGCKSSRLDVASAMAQCHRLESRGYLLYKIQDGKSKLSPCCGDTQEGWRYQQANILG